MSLISRIIPNLFNGVSQQPATLRTTSQAELVENAYPSIAVGLGKRPPTEHVAKISDAVLSNAFVTTLNRDATERYSLVITDGVIKVFDLFTGTEKTINPSFSMDYLTGINAAEDVSVVTVADYSFVINKKKTVKMTQELFGKTYAGQTITSLTKYPSVTLDNFDFEGSQVFSVTWEYIAGTNGNIQFLAPLNAPGFGVGSKVRLTAAGTVYDSRVNTLLNRDFIVTYMLDDASGLSAKIVKVVSPTFFGNGSQTSISMANFSTLATYSAKVVTSAVHGLTASSFVRIEAATPEGYNASSVVSAIPTTTSFEYNAAVHGALDVGSGSMRYVVIQGFKGSKQKFSDLPTSGQIEGDMWKIAGDPSQQRSRYYVMWDSINTVWVECADPTVSVAFDPTTMPHKLVREADGTFTFTEVEWDKRLVGDNKSIPIPSFVDRTISDTVFYRNRLGFLSDESLILSRSGTYFNFWGETATAVLDSDPIDITAAHTKVSILNWAVGFNKALLLYSDLTQFQLASGDVLTPKTAKLETVSEFESSNKARPVPAGQNVFFTLDKGTFSIMREYYVDVDSYTNDAADVTAHVPKYLPGGIYKLAASSSEDILLALSMKERNVIYVYKYYWGATEKLQSAWVKWTFPEGDTILNLDLITSTLSLTIQRSDGVYLEKVNLQQGETVEAVGHPVYLDRRVELTGTFNASTKRTTWALPYSEPEALSVVLAEGFDNAGALIPSTQPTATTVEANGDHTSGKVLIGRPYTKRYRFSEQYLKDSNNAAVLMGRLQMRSMKVSYSNSGYFRAEVTPKAREKNTYSWTGKRIGNVGFILGQTNIEDGEFTFPIKARSSEVTIDLVNDSHLPSFFNSAEWAATFTSNTSRRTASM
ncbi:hypothetical protein A7981_05685 [Methylovorus sp. MM2]|uniref:phage nozzle protein n=1 Tax=Methylovorus sp. MM2 TaxID=1848038 RepID=UPI0007E13C59|nr:hypothetical protein [Methylovorus sp. MM2]OAM52924.1 hypothetical protein A7981_05685 [Methylovorus sp. MM2]